MNRQKMLNAYRAVDKSTSGTSHPKQPSIYRSEYDEKLIKDYHFAKFRRNHAELSHNPTLKALLEKAEWDEEDVQTLLRQLN
ncbi:hypothetical protein FJM67_12930 [Maribrevibacterium harenarium]|uniref:Uncharacterized protein n=1 Tax=Maribrevibacterium harenarium TaxID=2589817 RepID=A0A501WJW9_9GAMM|nr:hypothetical protein [Maribrevibacterium harenarium]TPE48735.1 hypothetical protein FJM67_12930 [Maribrevibacterium harenarium]